MMSLTFFLTVAALLAAWLGFRAVSLGLWAAGVLTLVVLFHLHATDVLNLAF